jgi:uncharacterized protein (TIGR02147 family)
MARLFDVTDYREFLKSFYEQRKEELPLYSYRMMGNKLELDASQLFRILQKEQHLPARCVPLAKDLLGLTGRAAEYFELIIAASRTRHQKKREELFHKAYTLRDVYRREISAKELRFLSQWYIAPIRAYLEVSKGHADPAYIAARIVPKLSKEQVQEALEILKELGFVRKLSSGKLELSEPHLTVSGPDKSKAVREFQKQVMQVGAQSLDTIDKDQRDISTLTLAVDEDCFLDIREMAREFRRQIQKRVEEARNPDRIMQFNMALFPVSCEPESAS